MPRLVHCQNKVTEKLPTCSSANSLYMHKVQVRTYPYRHKVQYKKCSFMHKNSPACTFHKGQDKNMPTCTRCKIKYFRYCGAKHFKVSFEERKKSTISQLNFHPLYLILKTYFTFKMFKMSQIQIWIRIRGKNYATRLYCNYYIIFI